MFGHKKSVIVKVIGSKISWPTRCVGCNSQSQLLEREIESELGPGKSVQDISLNPFVPSRSTHFTIQGKCKYPICRSCSKYRNKLDIIPITLVGTPFVLFILRIVDKPKNPTADIVFYFIMSVVFIVGLFFFLKSLVDTRRYRKKINYYGPREFVSYKNILAASKEPVDYEKSKRLIFDGEVIHTFEFGNAEYANEFRRCNHIMT